MVCLVPDIVILTEVSRKRGAMVYFGNLCAYNVLIYPVKAVE